MSNEEWFEELCKYAPTLPWEIQEKKEDDMNELHALIYEMAEYYGFFHAYSDKANDVATIVQMPLFVYTFKTKSRFTQLSVRNRITNKFAFGKTVDNDEWDDLITYFIQEANKVVS